MLCSLFAAVCVMLCGVRAAARGALCARAPLQGARAVCVALARVAWSAVRPVSSLEHTARYGGPRGVDNRAEPRG